MSGRAQASFRPRRGQISFESLIESLTYLARLNLATARKPLWPYTLMVAMGFQPPIDNEQLGIGQANQPRPSFLYSIKDPRYPYQKVGSFSALQVGASRAGSVAAAWMNGFADFFYM